MVILLLPVVVGVMQHYFPSQLKLFAEETVTFSAQVNKKDHFYDLT